MVLMVINTLVWLRRESFGKRAHFIHWIVGNVGLFLTLTWVKSELKSELVIFMECAGFVFQIGIFSYITALMPLHGITVTVVAVIMELISIVYGDNKGQIKSAYQCFVIACNFLVPVALALAVTFCDRGKTVKPKAAATKKQPS